MTLDDDDSFVAFRESCESRLQSVQRSGDTVQHGEKNGFDSVFEIEVKNSCSCTVHSVLLRSLGFSSSIAVDPKQFHRKGEYYLVNDGQSVGSNQLVKFSGTPGTKAFSMSPASFSTRR